MSQVNQFQVDEELLDYMPWFIEKRQDEIFKLNQSLLESDFENIKRVGHGMKGVGAAFGVSQISDYGEAIESMAELEAVLDISEVLRRYQLLVNRLKEFFVS